MKTPFGKILERLEVVSRLENDESDDLSAIGSPDGLGVRYGSKESNEMRMEPCPCERALDAFLKGVPEETLRAIEVLMYAGRDFRGENVNFEEIVRYSHDVWHGADSAVNSVSEKTPRMEYIRDGIKLLGNKSVEDLHDEIVKLYGKRRVRSKN